MHPDIGCVAAAIAQLVECLVPNQTTGDRNPLAAPGLVKYKTHSALGTGTIAPLRDGVLKSRPMQVSERFRRSVANGAVWGSIPLTCSD